MNPFNEREGFSERLQLALRNGGYSSDSPTQLAREFNIRFEGRPITVHAARKWLVGEAIPTQEKLRILAQWLGVSTEWLRFGGALQESAEPADQRSRLKAGDLKLLEDLHRLDDEHQTIAREMLRMLIRLSPKRPS